jgi:hypothetical protein
MQIMYDPEKSALIQAFNKKRALALSKYLQKLDDDARQLQDALRAVCLRQENSNG